MTKSTTKQTADSIIESIPQDVAAEDLKGSEDIQSLVRAREDAQRELKEATELGDELRKLKAQCKLKDLHVKELQEANAKATAKAAEAENKARQKVPVVKFETRPNDRPYMMPTAVDPEGKVTGIQCQWVKAASTYVGLTFDFDACLQHFHLPDETQPGGHRWTRKRSGHQFKPKDINAAIMLLEHLEGREMKKARAYMHKAGEMVAKMTAKGPTKQ